ncbi:MAG: membrane protein insertase YidC [Amaricoccus sp.]
MDDQSRNLILATALSFLVILAWFLVGPMLFPNAFPPPTEQTATAPAGQAPADQAATGAPAETGAATAPGLTAPELKSRDAALALTQRVQIRTPRLEGSLSLTGGRIDDLKLTNYTETIKPDSPIVTLLTPAGAAEAYYSVFGWAPAGTLTQADVPGANTPWTIESGDTLTDKAPVTLRWDNGKGLIFRQTYAVDENYMFTLTQSVENNTGAEVRVQPYGTIARYGKPSNLKNFYILHEGAIRMADGNLEELKYKAMAGLPVLADEGGVPAEVTQVKENGWIGITDHYWMTTLTPPSGQAFTQVVKYTPATDIYQTDARLPVVAVPAGGKQEVTSGLFAGAKVWSILRDYQDTKPIKGFVDAIDWGWFFFLTKPIFRVLHEMHKLIGNMGIAIIGLTFIIKLILFPLAYKSYVSMSKMKALQPEMEKLKAAAGDDRVKMQQEMMALYKRERVNPAAGCLPIVLQIPIFFSLYKVIFVTIELRHAPFFGWIQDLSAPDPTSILNLFGLLPFAAPGPTSALGILSIGVWPIILGVSMWLQQKLNPVPADKTQAMIFAYMPWIFMFMLGHFASGLVIYWVANNTITFAQQYAIMRSQGVKPDVLSNILGPLKRLRKAG